MDKNILYKLSVTGLMSVVGSAFTVSVGGQSTNKPNRKKHNVIKGKRHCSLKSRANRRRAA